MNIAKWILAGACLIGGVHAANVLAQLVWLAYRVRTPAAVELATNFVAVLFVGFLLGAGYEVFRRSRP